MKITIGVLAVQGDVREHAAALTALGAEVVTVRRPGEVEQIDALVIPGGESTVMDKLVRAFELQEPLRKRIADGRPAYGSCAGMIRTHYGELFADDAGWSGRVAALASKTHELTDFLVNVLKLERVPGTFTGTVTYHDSCAGLREMGVKAQPRALLAKMDSVQLNEMADCEMCCECVFTFAGASAAPPAISMWAETLVAALTRP